MRGKDIILFDLDGTITDSKEGILASVCFALDYFNIKEKEEETLQKFIGPPLVDAFMEYYHMSEEEANVALFKYREFYSEKGVYMLSMYEGIDILFQKLKETGQKIVLATSKPLFYAEQIVERIGIKNYFDDLCGATMDETMNKKEDIIRFIIEKNGYEKERILMVGDRNHDIKGAFYNDVEALGVLYGYGSYEELQKAGCKYFASSVQELSQKLLENE